MLPARGKRAACAWPRATGAQPPADAALPAVPAPPPRRPAAEAVLLEVRASNLAAQALYARLGFERVGLRKRYYADGEDAVLMTLLLRPRTTS